MTWTIKPFFLTNESWYYFDFNELIYKLTPNTPQKAIDSYNQFYEFLDSGFNPIVSNG